MKKTLQILLLLAVLFLLINLLLNFSLTRIARQGRDGYGFTSPDSELGFFHNPGIRFKYGEDENIWTDDNGLRSCGSASEDFIYILGDSMIDLFADNCRLPSESMNNVDTSAHYISAACISFSTIQEYLLMKRLHNECSARRFLIFIYMGNDLFQNTQCSPYLPVIEGAAGNYKIILPEKVKDIPLTKRAILFSIVESWFFAQDQKNPDYWKDLMYGYTVDSLESEGGQMLSKTLFVIEQILEYAEDNNIVVGFHIIPSFPEVNAPASEEAVLMARFREKLITQMKLIQAPVNDLTNDIKAITGDITVYDPVNLHLTPEAWEQLSYRIISFPGD